MKPYSAVDSRKPLDRKKATSCLIVNQFATPGLGSLLGRRYIAGTGQIILALVGFCFLMLWFVSLYRSMYHELVGSAPAPANNQYGIYGALLFLASWIWAWLTSISLLREAKRNEPPLV